jgi:hypothetical protein
MKNQLPKKLLFLFVVFLFCITSFSQLPYKLIDGRENNYCKSCTQVIQNMPIEVLFGIDINAAGEVFFSMNNREYFNYIFKNDSYGVTADIVSKDKYSCEKSNPVTLSLPKGNILMPVYKPALLKEMKELTEGSIYVKIGKVPPALLKKELEGNLVIVNGNYICFYTNFVNIDRSNWDLLPMGLFTDSLLQDAVVLDNQKTSHFSYSKKIQIEVPFAKGVTQFSNSYINGLYDSLELKKYKIRKIEIRAYSSVEGPEKLNRQLMDKRAKAMITALKVYQPMTQRTKVITAENWLYFYDDIKNTRYKEFITLSKTEIKQKFTDKIISAELEPLLARQRKVIATLYLETASTESSLKDISLISELNKAVTIKDILKARIIQKELAERIIDKRLPLEFINKIEVPQSKEFAAFLNDREVYKFMVKATSEYEALENLLDIQKFDPNNGRINYNICVLRFFMWQNAGDTSITKILLPEINSLSSQGINNTLVKRMIINYYILKSYDQLQIFDYTGKNSSLGIIHDMYEGLNLNDEDLYSMAKYYSYYSIKQWAKEIIMPRIDKIDVSEDLVFYYVNLLFYETESYGSEHFKKAALNASNLNRKRFCDFFLPNDQGGASMQLLDHQEIKKMYCQECK